MAAQWFCQIAGAEIGPLSSQQIKTMVANGRLLPSDAMRQGASGPWFPAARVKGLFPPGQAPGGTPAAHSPASPARKNGHALPVARKTPQAAPAANAGKKAPGGQGGAVRAARPIVVPAGQPKQPRQAAPAKASAVDELFPEELAGGIPVPEKAINFDKFAIDTTPVKVTGRKSSRVGGMSKEQYKKMTRIMAAVIGGAFLLCIVLITISYLKSGKPAAPADATATASKPQESKPADAIVDKPAKADAHGAASSDKVAKTDAGKGAKTDAGKGAEPKKRVAATPSRRPAAKSAPAAKPAADSTAKAEGAATGKAAEKPRDPNAPIGPNDPVAPLDNLPPDQQ